MIRLWPACSEVRIRAGERKLPLLQNVQTGVGPAGSRTEWIPGILSPGVEQPKGHHPCPYSADVKNDQVYAITVCVGTTVPSP